MTDTDSTSALIGLGITIAEGVAQALPEALAALALVQNLIASGQDPSAENWATLDAAADALHASVQSPAATPSAG
jgi:hypothetical protein